MLRHAGVRSKLLAVLAIPTVLLVAATGLLVAGQVGTAETAGRVNALTDVALQVNRVVHALQEERSATLGYLQDGSGSNRARMLGQRRLVDQELTALQEKVAAARVDEMSERVARALARSEAAHGDLPSARRSVDNQVFFATEAGVFYGDVIQTDLRLPGAVAESGTSELAGRLRAYGALSAAIEHAAHERDLLEVAYMRGNIFETEYAEAGGLLAQQQQALQEFQQVAPPELAASLERALNKAEIFEVDIARRDMVQLLKGGEPDFTSAAGWVKAANTRISPMVAIESQLVADIANTATATQGEETQQALLLGGTALFGLALAIVLAVGLANRIAQPLRRLTVAAGEVGAELPLMVERMQTPGEGPGVEIEPISVESGDEVGRLAEAFNAVNEVTVRVAQEQAALRASISEMFVNVARRNQVLLSRQLAQIDRMEAREEDPDALDHLFKLDHLATRMRRNAESLLVLAGIDSTRRLRQTLPLSDVIRTAVSEIEAYDRVDLAMTQDPDVSGRLALTTAHLLAELLENATHFSNPETRVVVSAAVTEQGVDLAITDHGLGMSDDEIAEANAKIVDPPVAEIAVSQRLGLYVVGRLAQRLGATVALRRGRIAGTVAVVALPDSVFEGVARPALADGATSQDTEQAADVTRDEPAEPEPVILDDEAAAATPPRRRWGLWPRRGKAAQEAPVVDQDADVPLLVPAAGEAEAVPAPDTEDEVHEGEPVAEAAPQPEPQPEQEEEQEQEQEPAPAPAFEYAPAIDILPGRPMTARRPSPSKADRDRGTDVPQPRSATPAHTAELLPAFEPIPAGLAARASATAATLPAGPPSQAASGEGDMRRADVDAETASNALSELRGLYAPAFAPNGGSQSAESARPVGLTRRTPKATPETAAPAAASATGEPATLAATRKRKASEVRGMLSGFRAGVERGRTAPNPSTPADAPADPDRRTDQP